MGSFLFVIKPFLMSKTIQMHPQKPKQLFKAKALLDLSSHAEDPDAKKAYDGLVEYYLAKPFIPEIALGLARYVSCQVINARLDTESTLLHYEFEYEQILLLTLTPNLFINSIKSHIMDNYKGQAEDDISTLALNAFVSKEFTKAMSNDNIANFYAEYCLTVIARENAVDLLVALSPILAEEFSKQGSSPEIQEEQALSVISAIRERLKAMEVFMRIIDTPQNPGGKAITFQATDRISTALWGIVMETPDHIAQYHAKATTV